MSLFVEALGFGIVSASVLSLASVGFTLQYGITSIFNVAFATVMTIAALIAYSLDSLGVALPVSTVVAVAVGGVLTAVVNRVVFRPFARRGQGAFGMVLVSFAVALLLQYGAILLWGDNLFTFPNAQGGSLVVVGMVFTRVQLVIIAIAVASMAVVHLVLRYTKLGRAMRAISTNPDLARACGINTRRVIDIAWFMSGCLCGLSGVVYALNTVTFSSYTAGELVIVITAAAVLGGIGQPYGGMVGAVVIGIATELSALVIDPAYKDVSAFVLLMLFLLVRPQGLFGGVYSQEVVAT